jgi:hypothetical protein
MSETNSEHEQTKGGARGVRGVERASQYQLDSDRSTSPRRASSSPRSEPKRADRTVRAGAYQFKSRGQIAGGILRQLMIKADNQLARLDDRMNQLETERRKLEQEREEAKQEKEQLQILFENLQQATQDNP